MAFSLLRTGAFAFFVGVTLISAPHAQTQEDLSLDELEKEAVRLYYAGQYKMAFGFVKRVLKASGEEIDFENPKILRISTRLNGAELAHRTGAKPSIVEFVYMNSVTFLSKDLKDNDGQKTNRLMLARTLNNLALFYQSQRKLSKAEPLFVRALAIRKKMLAVDDPDIVQTINNLASIYQDQGRYKAARELFQKSVSSQKESNNTSKPDITKYLKQLSLRPDVGDDDSQDALTLELQFADLYNTFEYSDALDVAERALQAVIAKSGSSGPDHVRMFFYVGELYHRRGNTAKAELLYTHAISILEKASKTERVVFGKALNKLGLLYQRQGRFQSATELYNRAGIVREEVLRSDDPELIQATNNTLVLADRDGGVEQLGSFFRESVTALKKSAEKVPNSLSEYLGEIAKRHANQSIVSPRALRGEIKSLSDAGDHAAALKKAEILTNAGVKKFGPDAPVVGHVLYDTAVIYHALRQFGNAERVVKYSNEILEKSLVTQPDLVRKPYRDNITVITSLYLEQGRFSDLADLLEHTLSVHEKALGPEHDDVLFYERHLANIYMLGNRNTEAEPLLKHALATLEKKHGPEHIDVGKLLHKLALTYYHQDRTEEAEALLKECLRIFSKTHENVTDSILSPVLNSFAIIYQGQGRDQMAESLLERVLKMASTNYGITDARTALALNNLAEHYRSQAQFLKAEQRANLALSITEEIKGVGHPATAIPLTTLAAVFYSSGQFSKAEALLRRAIVSLERVKDGDKGAMLGFTRGNLGFVLLRQNQFSAALPLFEQALKSAEAVTHPQSSELYFALSGLAETYKGLGRAEKEKEVRNRLAKFPPPGTRHIPLYFATNRVLSSAEKFDGRISKTVSLGRAVMRAPAEEVKNRAKRIAKSFGHLESSKSGNLTGANALEQIRISKLESSKLFAASVRKSQKTAGTFKNQALIFVHGYNTTFEDAMKRAAQVAFDLKFDGILIPFAWPSQGSVRSYNLDNKHAVQSVDALVSFLDNFHQSLPDLKMHFLAHSMGNQVMLRALCQMAKRDSNSGKAHYNFGQVISAHADETHSNFEKLTKCFRPYVSGITLYVNENDTALRLRCLADITKFPGDHRCRAGNKAQAYTSVDVIDTTSMSKGFWQTLNSGFDHDVFVRNPTLFGDITRLLLNGKRPVEKRTFEFRPREDKTGNIFWVYDGSYGPSVMRVAATALGSLNRLRFFDHNADLLLQNNSAK